VAQEPNPYADFHSAETGQPFQDCISCGLKLEDPDLPYLVSKSFRRGECIFEYAICDDCRSSMAQEFSKVSRAKLAEFFEHRVKVKKRSAFLAFGLTPAPWIERCAACQTPRAAVESYSIGGVLLGSEMLFDPYPLCLCGKCEEEIQDSLSQKTRGMWDDFVDTHFDGPPADVEDLPRVGRPMVI
jgi:hypothetical protein